MDDTQMLYQILGRIEAHLAQMAIALTVLAQDAVIERNMPDDTFDDRIGDLLHLNLPEYEADDEPIT